MKDILKCPDCGGRMRLAPSRPDYPKLHYECENRFTKDCKGTHQAHPSGKPVGIPANRQTRLLRKKAHTFFEALFTGADRQSSYKILAFQLGVTEGEAHFGRMDEATLRRAIKLMTSRLKKKLPYTD